VSDRPTTGTVEQRSVPDAPAPTIEGNTLVGRIPLEVESRSFGSWRERIARGAFDSADRSQLVCTVEHDTGRVLGRFPTTLTVEDRDDCIEWRCDLPNGPTGQDVRESVRRGDLKSTSWRMVVARDRWEGDLRVVEEVREWRDCALVCHAAYGDHAPAELRAEPENPEPPRAAPDTEPEEATVPEIPEGAGLTVEDRAAAADPPSVEARVIDAIRSVSKGESRSLTVSNAEPIEPPELSTFMFDKLRPLAIALASGMSTHSTSRRQIVFPQITSDVDPSWVASGEEIPEGTPGIAALDAVPKKLAHRCEIENEVLDDSEPSVQELLDRHLSTMLALKLDRSVFEGNPAADPESIRGLKYTSGVQEILVATNGAALSNYDVFIRAVGMLRDSNVPGPYAIAMNGKVLTSLELLKDGQGNQLAAPKNLPPVYVSSQFSTVETAGTSSDTMSAFVYAPSQVHIVNRLDGEILLDRSRLFHLDMSEIRAKLRVDLLVPNPVAVVRVKGIKAA
jgi:HK97 family phage major capsid protein/HK97 family phage prohead protease